MSVAIEDYALLSDCRRAALVSRDGSIDWLCFPRFDSPACFAALLGDEENGRWQIATVGESRTERRYRQNTLVLETDFVTDQGRVRVTDALITDAAEPLLVRLVEGIEGEVPVFFDLRLRMDYGSIIPWVRRMSYGLKAIAGPEEIHVQSPLPLEGEDMRTTAKFSVKAGERFEFSLTWASYRRPDYTPPRGLAGLVEETAARWENYASLCHYKGPHRELVLRSILTLKALSFEPTGGIIAAPTTSLPECVGGIRNWDYRYCWLRDSTFSLYALLMAGYKQEATQWQEWLIRSVAGTPSQVNILYGVGGERRVPETEIPWLNGYRGSKPVRVGNEASRQLQLDVFGEVMDTLHLAVVNGLPQDEMAWKLQRCFTEFLSKHWHEPDEGIWEVRGPRRHFTHSKVMAWVAIDRAIRTAQHLGIDAPIAEWRALRLAIHADVCEKGFHAGKNSFTQFYGSDQVDASLLMIPMVGFLPATDPRVIGTIEAVQRELVRDGFVMRYRSNETLDGLPGGEGAFLACSFWLADCLFLIGRKEEAITLFEKLVGLANDLGLLSEEYDVKNKRLVGNFPQAFTHIGLINTAMNLWHHDSPVIHRSRCEEHVP